jgi:hypothetical protein
MSGADDENLYERTSREDRLEGKRMGYRIYPTGKIARGWRVFTWERVGR